MAMAMGERGGRAPHVAILSSPGFGHLIPVAELAKRLVLHHGFTATFITFTNFSSPEQDSFLSTLPAGLSSAVLPTILLSDLPSDARIETSIATLVAKSVPHVNSTLHYLKSTTQLTAYVVDIFGVDTLSAAAELGIPGFLFSTSTFMFLSLMLHLPALDAATSCEYRHLPDPVTLPGCLPVRGEDLIDPIQDRESEAYQWVLHLARGFRSADGLLVNSFQDLEPEAAKELKEGESGRPPAYPVGPLVRTVQNPAGGSECLEWLDGQPRGSVVFVSFGSGGTLSSLQTRELATGLEMSGQRFLWVVRSPSDKEASGAFFGRRDADEVFNVLPEGFRDRTRERGLVVPSWAPQIQVLSHRSTGGFLTHCGWNSTLESVVHGVPMIAWPLYAEQRMNAVLLVEGVGVALRPAVIGEEGVVGREEIARVVRELMEGEGGKVARKRVEEMKAAAAEAVREEGSSYKALAEVVTKWKPVSDE